MSDPSEASDLCTECGLCCDGGIFDYGPLSREEIAPSRQAGMAVVEADEKAGFVFPCPQLDCGVCQIYSIRPQTCRTYRCQTLKALDAGEIDLAEGLSRVKQGREAFEQVKAHLPEGKTVTDARRWRREAGKAESTAELNASPMLMMALGMLDVVIDQHFRRPDQRQVMPVD